MDEFYREVRLQDLARENLRNFCYNPSGKWVLGLAERQILPELRKPTLAQKSQLKAIAYWLRDYQPPVNASNLERVKGYLQAFEHLCELEMWSVARELLFVPVLEKKEENRAEFEPKKQLHAFLGHWGYYREQITVHSSLLHRIDRELDCFCWQGEGFASFVLGQFVRAIECYEQQLQLARSLDNLLEIARALDGLGLVYQSREHIPLALEYQQQCLEIAEQQQDRALVVEAWLNLGYSYVLLGQFRQAATASQKALTLARKWNLELLEGKALGLIGRNFTGRGKARQATPYLQQGLAVVERLGTVRDRWQALQILAHNDARDRKRDRAIARLNEALTIVREIGDRYGECIVLESLGGIYTRTKDYQTAIPHAKQSLALAQRLGCRDSEVLNLANLSYCYGCLQQFHPAWRLAWQILSRARRHNNPYWRGIGLLMLANAYWRTGRKFKGFAIAARAAFVLFGFRQFENIQYAFLVLFQELVKFLKFW